jgi:hypothetical protein
MVKLEWKSDFPVFRTAMDNPTAQAVVKAIETAKGSAVVQVMGLKERRNQSNRTSLVLIQPILTNLHNALFPPPTGAPVPE